MMRNLSTLITCTAALCLGPWLAPPGAAALPRPQAPALDRARCSTPRPKPSPRVGGLVAGPALVGRLGAGASHVAPRVAPRVAREPGAGAAPGRAADRPAAHRPEVAMDPIEDAELRARLYQVNHEEKWRTIVGGLMPSSSPRGVEAYRRAGLSAGQLAEVDDALVRWFHWEGPVLLPSNIRAAPGLLEAAGGPGGPGKAAQPRQHTRAMDPLSAAIEQAREAELRATLHKANKQQGRRFTARGPLRPIQEALKAYQRAGLWGKHMGHGGGWHKSGAGAPPDMINAGAGAPPA